MSHTPNLNNKHSSRNKLINQAHSQPPKHLKHMYMNKIKRDFQILQNYDDNDDDDHDDYSNRSAIEAM